MKRASADRGTGRQRAVREARRLFTDPGYEDTSIQDVLDASRLSRGALYHHFATKAELFAAVLEDVERELLARVGAATARSTSPREALRAGSLRFLEEALDPAVRQIVLIDAPNVLGWARWRALDERYAFGALRAVIQSGVESGDFAISPELVDSHAHAFLAAIVELGLLIAQAQDANAAQAAAADTIETLLRGLDGQALGRNGRPRTSGDG